MADQVQDSSSEDDQQVQDSSSEDDQQVVVLNRDRGYDRWREWRDSRIWHHLIFCEELENDDLQNGAFCWLCEKPVLRGTPAYKCLECYFLQHKSCVDQPHGLPIELHHVYGYWERHHLIFIKEDLQDNGGEEKKAIHQKRRTIKKKEKKKKVVCSGCKEPTTIGRDPAYKCSMPRCTFLLHKSCGELPTLIKHPLHFPDPYRDLDSDHILLLREPSTDHYCSFCLKAFRGSWFYESEVDVFYLHATCALLSMVNPDDCHQHKLSPSWKKVQFTCQSCGEETKDFAYVCSECRVLIHGNCAQFQHTIKTTTHDHSLIRTYSSLSHQLDVFCKLCYEKLNTEHAAYYCCRECGYVLHLDCAEKVRDLRPPNEWVPINSVDYLTHLVHLVEGINLAYDERVSRPEIRHFSHPEHNLILSNEEPVDDMRCEACMQFIISSAPFYGCTQCKFFLHDRCARLPRTIQRGIFHKHSLTLLSRARIENGLFKCNACERYRHGFVYNCSNINCSYDLDVQCCLIPETLKHEGHHHSLFLARRSSETCNACGKDCQDQDVRLVCTDCNFILCIRCATLPLVAKYQYETDLLKLSYTCEDDSEEYYCVICEEERNHPDHWFYSCIESKFTAHIQCLLGDDPSTKLESTYVGLYHTCLTFIRKTHDSPPCDICYMPFYGVALKCTKCKLNIHTLNNDYRCMYRPSRCNKQI